MHKHASIKGKEPKPALAPAPAPAPAPHLVFSALTSIKNPNPNSFNPILSLADILSRLLAGEAASWIQTIVSASVDFDSFDGIVEPVQFDPQPVRCMQPPWDTEIGNKFIIHFTYGCDYDMKVTLVKKVNEATANIPNWGS
ncbi:Hydroxyproline O-arabinosyltransferase 1 [Camellia lanceoleosa]|uniref:Hydroxyproline O-arabinosyltransferase 1 n=1 Tax=Camellia lanceoleosa TaxID=1840588 RepID=A0ACC0FLA1_9ERIC|nr:Hydroxyproline O-arabinosyltransferase 1 [Camellia lanceoleosa]